MGGEALLKPEILNKFLNEYVKRLEDSIKESKIEGQKNERFTVRQVLMFLEMYAQFIKNNSRMQEVVESQTLIQFTNEKFVYEQIDRLSMH